MKKVKGKGLFILGTCVVAVLCAVLGWLIPDAMTSFEMKKYYDGLEVADKDEIYAARFSVVNGVDPKTFTDVLDGKDYIEGYMGANCTATVTARGAGKDIVSTAIFKTGKWSEKNTYKIVEGNDLPDEFTGRVPVLVSEKQWKKYSVGDNLELTIPTVDGNTDVIDAYVAGKISNERAIAGIHFYFTEPYAGDVIIPDIGVEKYVENASGSFVVMFDMHGSGTLRDLISEVQGIAKAQPQSERDVNYETITRQRDKKEYKIYVAVIIAVVTAVAASLSDSKHRIVNFAVAAGVTAVFTIIFTAVKFPKTLSYEVSEFSSFYRCASVFLKNTIIADVAYFAATAVLVFGIGILISVLLKNKSKRIVEESRAKEKLYD